MFGLPYSHKKEKIVAAADIGSGHAGCALIEIRRGEIPAILASARLALPFEERTPEQTKSGVLSLLKDVCEKAAESHAEISARQKLPPISASYAILQAPWSRSEIASAGLAFETDGRIIGKMIEGLARQALETEDKLNHRNLFEAGLVRVDLNGYPTMKPVGKDAHTVSVSTLVSECEPETRAQITDTLQNAFPAAKPNLRSRARILSSALREARPQSRDYVIIDMENDATNCAVMRDGLASEHILVPEGTRTILKRISTGMPEETLSLMRMISRGACNTPSCDKLNSSLALAEPEIVRLFGDALGRIAGKLRLPNELLLITEPELSEWLSALFSRIDFSQFTVTTKEFTPSVLASESLRGSVSGSGGAIDSGLALAAIFVNAEEQST